MSSEAISAFLKAIQHDDNLKTQLMAADADVAAIAKAAGYELDASALTALTDLLSEAELDSVAGGAVKEGGSHYSVRDYAC